MVLFNPTAGAGRADRAAHRIAECLRDAGHEGVLVETLADPGGRWLDDLLPEVAVVVVVGGDGTVRLASGPAIRSDTPIYHIPFGTENLFAREFGMDRRPQTLLRALGRFDLRRVDLGIANGQPFLLMASIGFDAEVVHDLAGRRGRSISHFSYAGPVLRQLLHWRPSRVAVTVDGRAVDPEAVQDRRACVIVANSRQYAWRLNPARRADMSDGRLDVVYLPVRSTVDLVSWIAKCYRGRHFADPRLIHELGRTIEIVCDEPQRFQLDGDPPIGGEEAMTRRLCLSVQPQVLSVLMPQPNRVAGRRFVSSARGGQADLDMGRYVGLSQVCTTRLR